MPNTIDLLNFPISPEVSECLNTTFNELYVHNIDENISNISMNMIEANSSTPKVQFNIGDSANHPVATVTPLENEVDSGFISSEVVNVTELCKDPVEILPNDKCIDEDEVVEVIKYFKFSVKILIYIFHNF